MHRLRGQIQSRKAKPPYLTTAAHEVGHAVARLVINEWPPVPGPPLLSVEISPHSDKNWARMEPRLSSVDPPARNTDTLRAARREIIELLAGPMAEERWAPRRIARRWAPCFASLSFAVSHLYGHIYERRREHPPYDDLPNFDRSDDLNKVVMLAEWMHASDDGMHRRSDYGIHDALDAEIGRLLRVTGWLIETEWPGIARMTRILHAAKTLPGEAFRAVWLSKRPEETTRRRRRSVGPH
jgi:hypothetical protein